MAVAVVAWQAKTSAQNDEKLVLVSITTIIVVAMIRV
jgi:hypothetical protein